MVGQGLALDQLVGNAAVQFDARQFNWIGRMVPVIQFVVVWHTAPAKTLQDVMQQEVVIAATSPTGATGTVPRFAAPPKVPADRMKVLCAGFDGMMQAFLEEAKKASLEVAALDGEGIAKIVHETLDVTPDFAKRVATALAE